MPQIDENTIERFKRKLEKMVNKTYLYLGHEHIVISYKFTSDGAAYIVTNKSWVECPVNELSARLEEFLPISNEVVALSSPGASVAVRLQSEAPNLIDTILDNIQKVKEDRSYVKQANAVCQSVNAIVNIAKLELTIQKSINRA